MKSKEYIIREKNHRVDSLSISLSFPADDFVCVSFTFEIETLTVVIGIDTVYDNLQAIVLRLVRLGRNPSEEAKDSSAVFGDIEGRVEVAFSMVESALWIQASYFFQGQPGSPRALAEIHLEGDKCDIDGLVQFLASEAGVRLES
jgi:hypothetical protein